MVAGLDLNPQPVSTGAPLFFASLEYGLQSYKRRDYLGFPMNRAGDTPTRPPEIQAELERFRNYLRFLAEIKLDRRLRRRIDASDIVQETLLRAYVAWDTFRGNDSAQRVAWLRQILMRTILHALRDARCAKRRYGP